MLKYFLPIAVTFAFALAFGAERAHAQARIGFDDAIQGAAGAFASHLGGNLRVAVVNMDGGTVDMSSHLITRMNAALVRAGVAVVERERLQAVFDEQNIQMYGRFDQARTVSITRGLGAQYIVVGAFQCVADNHFNARIICVETHIVARKYEANVRDSRLIRDLLGKGFTQAERGQAMALNLLPGVGSFVIMEDPFGGAVQVAVGGAGWGMLIGGVAMGFTRMVSQPVWGDMVRETNGAAVGLAVGGAALVAAQNVFNIFRSLNYNRPTAQGVAMASFAESWGIAIAPGEDGIYRVSLSYTVRF